MGNFWDDLMETDEKAAEYMQTYGEGPGCETRQVIGSFINDGETVLDVGCGPGWNLDHFTTYGPMVSTYKGLDYSERFVRIANERAKDKKYVVARAEDGSTKGSYFFVGDCRKLEEPDGSWDVVILQDVLEHTNGYEKPVLEALRVARNRIVISFWHLQDTDDPHINDDGNDGWGAWYDKKKWEDFLNGLPWPWYDTESSPEANRQHSFYVIDKEKAEDA